ASVRSASGLLRPQILEGRKDVFSLLAAVQALQGSAVVHQDPGLLGSELGRLLQDLGSLLGLIQARIIFSQLIEGVVVFRLGLEDSLQVVHRLRYPALPVIENTPCVSGSTELGIDGQSPVEVLKGLVGLSHSLTDGQLIEAAG